MASNGLEKIAIRGKCRICQRQRFTGTNGNEAHVKRVGEVRHGFATGYIWECVNIDDCHNTAQSKLATVDISTKNRITHALEEGNYKEYKIFS